MQEAVTAKTVASRAYRSHLASLGALAEMLSADKLLPSLDRAVRHLRETWLAEQACLYWLLPGGVREPAARSTSCRPRGKRTEKRSVPIRGPLGACLAELEVLWSGPVPPGAEESLDECSSLLGLLLRAGLATHREHAAAALRRAGGPGPLSAAFLLAMRNTAGARRATLITTDLPRPQIATTGAQADVCAGALDGDRFSCRLLAEGLPRILGSDRNRWPEPCRRMTAQTLSPCCLPLLHDKELRGAVVLDYGDGLPRPRGRDLLPLLEMARAAEPYLPGDPATPDTGIDIRCLGGFEITVNGRPLPPSAFRRRKARVLLQLLLIAQARPVPRDELASVLWPGVDPVTGANRLHGVVHALREALEPGRQRGGGALVAKENDGYCLRLEPGQRVDLQVFAAHQAAATRAEARGAETEAIAEYRSAMELYRGDLFAGEPDSSWCQPEREEWRRRYLAVVSRLAELLVATGAPDQAVECLRAGLRVDPLREDLHQHLIETLLDCGRRDEARAQYERCARALREELDIEPLPATRRLLRLAATNLPGV